MLDQDEVVRGFEAGKAKSPEPPESMGLAYWHGWRNGMADAGHVPYDEHQISVMREFHLFLKRASDTVH